MKKIFISYRRNDFFDTNRLATVLKSEFGAGNVFFDTLTLRPGNEWPAAIQSFLMQAHLFLLIIGPRWLHEQDKLTGRRRIDLPSDWVRTEFLTFLERKKANPELVLIPVMVNGAKMPEKHHLDEALSSLPDYHYIALDNSGRTSDFIHLRTEIIKQGINPINLPPIETPRGFPVPEQLSPEEENEFLRLYPNWTISETEKPGMSGDFFRELYCFYEFPNYGEAWRFLEQVNEKVIRVLNHHPRWQNTFLRVEFWLSTFNIGHKPTKRDLQFAQKLEEVWAAFQSSGTAEGGDVRAEVD